MTVELHKGYVPGAIGRVAELHATYYQRIPGFGVFFESRVARELAQFCEAYDDDRDGLWLAHLDGGIEGAIAIDGTHAGKDGAHLRWFITSDKVRGTGIGRKLLASAVEFCRACHYDRIYLDTFEGLVAARHLYEKFGFRLVHQQSGMQWGAEVAEQRFELRA